MSEKLDGVRCYTNGSGTMYTRNGNLFHAPKWWKAQLPPGLALDGELFTDRNDF
jgi:DNA ligase 1